MSQQFSLLKERRFLPFFTTQFFGAFNDNLYKNALIVLLTFQAANYTTLDTGILVNLCAGLFILPFFLFSSTAGQLADKFEKSRLIRYTKLLEIFVMLLAVCAFYFRSLSGMLVCLFLMGAQSSLFGPVKYAILPQHLKEEELLGGNALVESGTFIAILVGTLAGGMLAGWENGLVWLSIILLSLAALGFLASCAIPVAPAAAPELNMNWNPATETWRSLRFISRNRRVFLSILGISWFWFYGAVFLTQLPAFAKDVLGGNEQLVTVMLAVFSVGVGIGSLLCERLSLRKVEIGLVVTGSIGLSIFAIDVWWSCRGVAPVGEPLSLATLLTLGSTWRILADLLLIGMFGGFFIVPLYTQMQIRSEMAHRSRVIAGNNIMNALFMVGAALMGAGLLKLGLSVPALLLVNAALNVVVGIYIFRLEPKALPRFIARLARHVVRMRSGEPR